MMGSVLDKPVGFPPEKTWRKASFRLRSCLALAAMASNSIPMVPAFAQDEQKPVIVHAGLKDVVGHVEYHMVPMRDGIRLWTAVHFPKNASEKLGTVLIRTPYASESGEFVQSFLRNGFAVILQNERGRYWSEGEYHIISNAGPDGYDTVDWISKQPWSNGKVGTYGCSSSGDSQTKLAASGHPAHAAAINGGSGSSIGRIGAFNEQGAFYRGGVLNSAWLSWYLLLGQRDFPKFPKGISDRNRDLIAREAAEKNMMNPGFTEFTSESTNAAIASLPFADAISRNGGQVGTDFDYLSKLTPNDPRWKPWETAFLQEGDKVSTPTLWLFQTHDLANGPNLAGFEYILDKGHKNAAAKAGQKMIMSPLGHCSYGSEREKTIDGDRPIGDARFPFEQTFLNWFDHYLRGRGPGVDTMPRAQVYVPGNNRWVSLPEWPIPNTVHTPFYLESRGDAGSRFGDGRLLQQPDPQAGVDSFHYDPRYPVPTVGGDACCIGDIGGSTSRPGSFDQSTVEARKDVLVYTSLPLEADLDTVGFAEVELYVSSDAPDTDFAANLVDVAPDGRAFILGGSIQRMRWRDGYDKPNFMTPGQTYKVRVGPFFISNRFEKGHRIRIDISSSNFPRWERNLNTGGPNYNETQGRIANNSVRHGQVFPSKISLPVVRLKE